MIPIFQEWKSEDRLMNALTDDLNQPSKWNNLNQQTEQNDQNRADEGNDLNRMDGQNDENSLGGGENGLLRTDGQDEGDGVDECLTISETPTFEQEQQQDQQQWQHTASTGASSSKASENLSPNDEPDDEQGITYSRSKKTVTLPFRSVQTEAKRPFPMPKNGNGTGRGRHDGKCSPLFQS